MLTNSSNTFYWMFGLVCPSISKHIHKQMIKTRLPFSCRYMVQYTERDGKILRHYKCKCDLNISSMNPKMLRTYIRAKSVCSLTHQTPLTASSSSSGIPLKVRRITSRADNNWNWLKQLRIRASLDFNSVCAAFSNYLVNISAVNL